MQLNPDFALQSRLSFGRGGRYAFGMLAAALLIGFGGPSFDTPVIPALAYAASLLLVAAPSFAAVQIRALERDGRLDTRRLTGQSTLSLAAALLAGSSWLLVAFGVVLLLVAAVAGHTPGVLPLVAMALLGFALMLLVLILPPSLRIDSWGMVALMTLAIGSAVQAIATQRSAAIGMAVVSALTCAWAVPVALRRMRGARPAASDTRFRLLHVIANMRGSSNPEFARAFLGSGAVLLVGLTLSIAAPVVVYALTLKWDAGFRDMFEVLLVYAPLALAGYDVAARLQLERQRGDFDRMRLTARSPGVGVIEQAAALAGPFLIVSVVAAASIVWLDPVNAWLVQRWPLIAVVLVLGPSVGVLNDHPAALTITLVMPLALAVGAPISTWEPATLLAAAVIGLLLINEDLATREDPRLLMTVGATVLAVITGGLPMDSGIVVVAAVIPLAFGILAPTRARLSTGTIVGAVCGAAVGAAGAEYVWVGGNGSLRVDVDHFRGTVWYHSVRIGPGLYAFAVGAAAGAAVYFACRASNRWRTDGLRSLLVRATPLILAMIFSVASTSTQLRHVNLDVIEPYGYDTAGVLEFSVPIALAIAALAIRARRRRF